MEKLCAPVVDLEISRLSGTSRFISRVQYRELLSGIFGYLSVNVFHMIIGYKSSVGGFTSFIVQHRPARMEKSQVQLSSSLGIWDECRRSIPL